MKQTTKANTSVPSVKQKTVRIANTMRETKTCFQTASELKRKLNSLPKLFTIKLLTKLNFCNNIFDHAGFTSNHYLKLLRLTSIRWDSPHHRVKILIQLFSSVYSAQRHIAKQFSHLLLLFIRNRLTPCNRTQHPCLGWLCRNSKLLTLLNEGVIQKEQSPSTILSN